MKSFILYLLIFWIISTLHSLLQHHSHSVSLLLLNIHVSSTQLKVGEIKVFSQGLSEEI